MVEYVLIVTFVVLVALIGIKTFGNTTTNAMWTNNNSVSNAIQ